MAVDGLFSVLKTPQAAPGKCAGCGKAKCELGFVDTDFQADYYGAVIYCYECIADMAGKLGFLTPVAAESLRNKLVELEIETANQRAAILGLEQSVDGLLAARDSGAVSFSVPTQSDSTAESENALTITGVQIGPTEEEIRNQLAAGTESDVDFRNTEINNDFVEQEPVGVSSNISIDSWAELGIDL